ncbi:MAG: MCE family protein [Aeromicrobium sp.]
MESKRSPFDREMTEEEIQQILRDRDERLDPANRPENAEVDNGDREWDYDNDDFADNIVGGRSKFHHAKPHVAPIENSRSLRTMGVGLTLVCLFFGWLTWAFFTKAFTEHDDVKLVASKSGLAMPERADVKLRGMIVGVVRETKIENGRVVMTLGMDPKLITRVPRNVRAEMVPKTLFGEKYVSLVPTSVGTTEHLLAGDTITDATVPVEFEKFFNDVYPLLTAIPPEKVSYTLTALSNSLEGRGEALGETLEESNDYLKKLNPDNKQAIADIVALGEVSRTYSGQMKNFGKLLRNSSKVSRTVTDKDDELADLFKEAGKLADVLRVFLAASGDDIVTTAHNSVQPLQVGAEYSTMFPCWFKGQNALIDNVVNEVFNNNYLHIAMVTTSPQPSRFGQPGDPQPEHPIIPTEATVESMDFSQPEIHGYKPNPGDPGNPFPAGLGTVCDELYEAAKGNPRTPDEPFPYQASFWREFGIRNSHNGKLGTDAEYNRAAVSSDVGDVASLLVSPMVLR